MQRKISGKLSFIKSILLLSAIFLSLLEGIQIVSATTNEDYTAKEQFILQQGSFRMYLTSLDEGETLSINCTALYHGKFYLYLYDHRPTGDNFLENSTSYPNLGNSLVAYNETPSLVFSEAINDTVYTTFLNYTAGENKLHYLEIRLVENGPDTFLLETYTGAENHEIQAYYVPFIPGYTSYYLGIIVIGSVGGIIYRIQKKIK